MENWNDLSADEKLARLAHAIFLLNKEKMFDPHEGYEVLYVNDKLTAKGWHDYLGIFDNVFKILEKDK